MLIEVTADDIREGARLSVFSCPVARAMSRAMRTAIVVNGTSWRMDGAVGDLRPLPKDVENWILDFDTFNEVLPFSFEVNE